MLFDGVGKKRKRRGKNRIARQGELALVAGDLERSLLRYAEELFRRSGGLPEPRIGVLRPTGMDEGRARDMVAGLGPEGMLQALAILARTAQPGELVFLIARTHVSGPGLDGTGIGRRQRAAMVFARSVDGRRVAHLFSAEVGKHRTEIRSMALGKTSFDDYGDYTDPGFFVDPKLDDHLAKHGLPGAIARIGTPLVSMAGAAASGPTPAKSVRRAERASIAEPVASVERLRPISLPKPSWEAGRKLGMLDLGANDLVGGPMCFIPGARPLGFLERSLDELLSHRWASEAQVTHLGIRLLIEADLRASLERTLDAALPTRAEMLACATAAAEARARDDAATRDLALVELRRRIDGAASSAGGLDAWLASEWPADLDDRGSLASVCLAAISCGLAVALDAQVAALANGRMPSDAIDLDAWLAVGRRVRAWLLERLDAPPGPPAPRIAALAARVFAVVPSSRGETRAQRWRDVLASRAGTRALVDSMAEYGAWHATMLHSLLVIADLLRASLAAFEGHDLDGYQPENIDPSGLLGTANDVVAHHLVLKAAICDNDALDLLARARVIAPRNELVLGCSNEARFRAGARDAALLSDLRSEQRARRSLACAAELLAVAEELGAKAHRLRADLLRLARGTPHAWIATARVTLARPQALASVERVQALLSETPSSRVDAKDRAGFALYGADPPAAVADLRRALETQRDALEWQALVAEIESEPKPAERGASDERSDEPRHRPRMPARGEPDSLARAMHALRVRLDRPAVARSIHKRVLEAHARRAAELTSNDVAEPHTSEPHTSESEHGWLRALAEADVGLIAQLDLLLDGRASDERLTAALERAERELTAELTRVWQGSMYLRMAAVWPLLTRPGPVAREVRRRAAALEQAVQAAVQGADHRADTETRAQLERDLTDLLAEAGSADAAADVEPDEMSEEDGFALMHLSSQALERSRRELATPEWALHEGLRQVTYFNLARGRRDIKMLRGTRGSEGALWELRHRDSRRPVRVLYRLGSTGPQVVAILAKENDEHQRRMLARVITWMT